MQRFFIADIHLNENEPVITTGFLHFLQKLPNDCELYILGDLFDYWIGDDVTSTLHQVIADALRQLSARNIQTYFIHGNRDFLLGNQYAKQCQIQLLPEIKQLKSDHDCQYSKQLILLHGDLLCIDDKAYQMFRRRIHSKWLQTLFLLLPRFYRRWIANRLRRKSQQHNQQKAAYIMDVNQGAVESMMKMYQADTMIHGHIHKPAVHQFEIDGKSVNRMVLGAWHDGINYIHQHDNGEITLVRE